jgi:hypothetical protein
MALIGWAILFAVLYRLLRGSRTIAIVTVGALVVGHWVLDVVTHRRDLPLTISGSERLGLGLWNRPFVAIPLELILFGVGVGLYMQATRATTTSGRVGLWLPIVFLVATYFAALFGPPPPNTRALAWSANAMWLLIAWGYWLDRQRRPA